MAGNPKEVRSLKPREFSANQRLTATSTTRLLSWQLISSQERSGNNPKIVSGDVICFIGSVCADSLPGQQHRVRTESTNVWGRVVGLTVLPPINAT